MLLSGSNKDEKLQIAAFNMYLIDTDILIWVLRGNEKYEKLLQNLKDKEALSISTVTITEIYKNIFPSEFVKTESLLNELQTWDITPAIAKQAGLYWQEFVKHLKNLNLMDCLIAGTANVNDLTLVSLNMKHFPMKDIKTLNPIR